MNFKLARNIKLGVKTLLLHKLRSFLTMLGVVFGVGSVVAMLAVGEGASAEALERIRKLGSTNIILESMKPAEDEGSGTVRIDGTRLVIRRPEEGDFEAWFATLPASIEALDLTGLKRAE